MKTPVPSLSMTGWCWNPREALDLLVTYLFLSNASQSTIYYGEVRTAPEILQRLAHDPDSAANELATTLNNMLRKYFDETSIAITTKLYDEETSASVVEFTLSGYVMDEGTSYQLNRLARVKDGKFLNFTEINNG